MLYNIIDLTSLSFINFDELNIIDLLSMFAGCYPLIYAVFSSFNVENIENMCLFSLVVLH